MGERRKRKRINVVSLGGVPMSLRDILHLIDKAQNIYDAAVKDLGPGLSGYSIKDLLADNMPNSPLSVIDEIITYLKKHNKR